MSLYSTHSSKSTQQLMNETWERSNNKMNIMELENGGLPKRKTEKNLKHFPCHSPYIHPKTQAFPLHFHSFHLLIPNIFLEIVKWIQYFSFSSAVTLTLSIPQPYNTAGQASHAYFYLRTLPLHAYNKASVSPPHL